MSNELTLQGISASLGKAHGPSNGWHKYEICPICKNEHPNNPAFAVDWKTGVFKCHDCGSGGKILDLIVEGKVNLNQHVNDRESENEIKYEKLDSEFNKFTVADEGSLTFSYLNYRGIKTSTLKMLEVPLREGIGNSNRISVYPFFSSKGDVVAFQSTFLNYDTLSFEDKDRRMKGKKSIGVGILRQKPKMIVCEGLETGLSVLQYLGGDYGLIVCGDANGIKSLSKDNGWALKGVKQILIATDNDKSNTGIKAARALVNAFPKKTAMFMPSLPGMDWNDVLLNNCFEEEWL